FTAEGAKGAEERQEERVLAFSSSCLRALRDLRGESSSLSPVSGRGLMAARSIRTFTVLPRLPARLQALHKLAYNLWLTWSHDGIALFRRIDADLWEAVGHSPVKLLGAVSQARLEELLDDDGFLTHVDRAE